ncbi:MAG: hypothetical protein ACLFVQ_10310 [Chitinispirillaceae bacterium]
MRRYFKIAMIVSGAVFLLHTALMVALLLKSMFVYSIVVHPHSLQLPILIAGPASLVLFALFSLMELFTSKRRFWVKLVTYALPLFCLVTGAGYGTLMVFYHRGNSPCQELETVYRSPDDPGARLVSIREKNGRADRYLLVKKQWGVIRLARIVSEYTREKWERSGSDGAAPGLRTEDNLYMVKIGAR